MRGGALKATTKDQWCHITCALPIKEIIFQDSVHRQPVNITKITAARRKLVKGQNLCERLARGSETSKLVLLFY